MSKILVVDDEKDMLTLFGEFLRSEGFSVVTAQTVPDAWLAAVDGRPDVILCDVSIGSEDGIAFCGRVKKDRRTKATPVILMSGVRLGVQSQVKGLDLGADDYLPKPFSPSVLAAKVRAALRRKAAGAGAVEPAEGTLSRDGLVLEAASRVATLRGKRLPLTRKEFDLLAALLGAPGRVLSPQYLLETVWGYDPAVYNDPHTVTVHVSSLRRKLGAPWAKRIVSVPGLGYRLEKA